MKKIINLYEEEFSIGNKTYTSKIGVVKESLLSSILSDTYTFGILVLSFWINQTYIHSRIMSCILLFCFLLQLMSGSKIKIVSKSEFRAIVNKYLRGENECKR